MGKLKKKHKNLRVRKRLQAGDVTIPQLAEDNKENAGSVSNVENLLQDAESHLDKFEYPEAQKILDKILQVQPDNTKALELSSAFLIECGERDAAMHCLGRAITVDPDAGYSKYFSLAQLMGGATAADLYMKGILLCNNAITQHQGDKESSKLQRDLSCAYISIAELYMTDLCDEEEAEKLCTEHIESAITADSNNPEAYQCKANYLLITENIEPARDVMQQSLSLWFKDDSLAATTSNDAASSSNTTTVDDCPLNYPARVAAAKILVELEEFDIVAQILDNLIEEDDAQVEVWYIHGWSNYLRGEEFYGNAKHYLERAKQLYESQGAEDLELFAHINELLQTIPTCEDEECRGDEWEDVISDDDDTTNDDAML